MISVVAVNDNCSSTIEGTSCACTRASWWLQNLQYTRKSTVRIKHDLKPLALHTCAAGPTQAVPEERGLHCLNLQVPFSTIMYTDLPLPDSRTAHSLRPMPASSARLPPSACMFSVTVCPAWAGGGHTHPADPPDQWRSASNYIDLHTCCAIAALPKNCGLMRPQSSVVVFSALDDQRTAVHRPPLSNESACS